MQKEKRLISALNNPTRVDMVFIWHLIISKYGTKPFYSGVPPPQQVKNPSEAGANINAKIWWDKKAINQLFLLSSILTGWPHTFGLVPN